MTKVLYCPRVPKSKKLSEKKLSIGEVRRWRLPLTNAWQDTVASGSL